MTHTSKLTDPSELSKNHLQISGLIIRTLQGILEAPVSPTKTTLLQMGEPLTMAEYTDLRFFMNQGKVEALTALWNLNTLEVFQDFFGPDCLVPTLLESTLDELCLDTVLVPLLSDFLQTEGSVSKDGTRGWITGSQLQTFCSQTLGGKNI